MRFFQALLIYFALFTYQNKKKQKTKGMGLHECYQNARIFEDKARNSEYLWDSIVFLASLWAFCSKVFKGTPLNVLQFDWLAVCTP